uniref:DUF2040 domain-containing protein n=1 Tax=Steinernema glaseri TaxID=37863 RepID=A0A1I7ZQP9_9BILA
MDRGEIVYTNIKDDDEGETKPYPGGILSPSAKKAADLAAKSAALEAAYEKEKELREIREKEAIMNQKEALKEYEAFYETFKKSTNDTHKEALKEYEAFYEKFKNR